MTQQPNVPPRWYRKRHYLHFDRPLGLRRASQIVESPQKVAKHAFYPLIKYQIESEKVHEAADGSGLERSTKTRDIAYASHADSHIYSYYATKLEALYEEHLSRAGTSPCVLAFRSLGKSNIEFAATAFDEINSRSECTAVALDVSGFFDNLDHKILKEQWCDLLGVPSLPCDHYKIFRSITHFSVVDRDALYRKFSISPTNPKFERSRACKPSEFRSIVRNSGLISTNTESFGIPQGTPISAMLSNIYMMQFDIAMKQYVDEINGTYMRYCDDILLIVPTPEAENSVRVSRKSIGDLRLDLNSKKTVTRKFERHSGTLICDKPLQYLGFTFDGKHVLIRSAAFARFSNRMRRGVRLAKATHARWSGIRTNHGANTKDLYRRSLYNKYSYLGRRNFITYGHRAARIMKSHSIRQQLKPWWRRLIEQIDKNKS